MPRRSLGLDRPLQFGILGCARNVPFSVLKPKQENPDLAARMEIAGIASSSEPSEAETRAKQWGIAKSYASFDELLADSKIDVVYNVAPVNERCHWTIKALQAGKHVLSETPTCSNALESMAMQRAAEDHGRVLLEGAHPACHPVTQRVREMIIEGKVGALEHIDLHVPLAQALEGKLSGTSKGALLSLGCHGIATVRALAGEDPVVINATAQLMKDSPDIDEKISCNLKFPCAAGAHISCSVAQPTSENPTILTVSGSGGTIRVKEWFAGSTRGSHEIELDQYEETGEKIFERLSTPPEHNTFYFMLHTFIDEVSEQERRQVVGLPWSYTRSGGPQDAVRNMAVIDAVYKAANMKARETMSHLPPPYDAVLRLSKL